ncbi:MAG: hypothetical protein M1840_002178 [Geoglossum simile]|nr:MAG: hypothetical protein M1840_002178 [Geoglossum simile]
MANQTPHTKLQFKNSRLAVASDLPQIVKITQEALLYDDFYNYHWPNIERFPNEHKRFLEGISNYYLSNSKYAVHVLELDQSKNGDVGDRATAEESLVCSFVAWKSLGNSWWETTVDHRMF